MPKIKAYHRPKTIEEALQLISRPDVNTAVIGGGTHLVPRMSELVDEVVDLQAVGLAGINYTGRGVTLGAAVTLQEIVDDDRAPALLRNSARREGPNTVRHAATLGGVVAAPNRESELLAALLVFDAQVTVQNGNGTKTIPLDTCLRDVPAALGGGLITAVSLSTMGKTASDRVARTPADRPIVAALARKGNDGKVRLALCGVANVPVLVDPANVKATVNPPGDFKGSTEYRRQMAATLTKRVVGNLA